MHHSKEIQIKNKQPPKCKTGFPGGSEVKNPPANAGDTGLIPGVEKIPWRRKWQTTPVVLIGKFHGQSSWQPIVHRVVKESDTTYQLNNTNNKPQDMISSGASLHHGTCKDCPSKETSK